MPDLAGAPEEIRTPDPQIRSQRILPTDLTTLEIRNDQEVAKLRRHSIFLIHSLSLSPERAIVTHHEHSASAIVSASTSLPTAELIPLPTANRKKSARGVFTKATVRRMQCNSGKQEKFFWDAGCRGFGLRALRSGQRSWIYQYRDEHGRTRRIVLGDVSAVSLEDARTAARRTAASVAHGTNPSVERKKKRITGTVLQVIEAYLTHAKGRQRPRSYKETPGRRQHHRHLHLGFRRPDLEANDAFLRMVGYDHEDLVAGRIRWTDLTPPEWRDRDARLIQEHKVTGILQPFEKEYFRKDGSRVPVLIGAATFEEGGNQGVAFVLDLTERKRAEEALRESEAKFRDYAETASDWFWEIGPDYKFTLLTENAFGSHAADRIGTACWDHALDLETEPEKWRLVWATLDSRQAVP